MREISTASTVARILCTCTRCMNGQEQQFHGDKQGVGFRGLNTNHGESAGKQHGKYNAHCDYIGHHNPQKGPCTFLVYT